MDSHCPQAAQVQRCLPAIDLCRDDLRLEGGGELLRLYEAEPAVDRPACRSRSTRATSISVVSPACNAVTSLTPHTSFAISSQSPREPKIDRNRNKIHRFACSHIRTLVVALSANFYQR